MIKFDEVRMNEIAADAMYSLTFIDTPLYDKDVYKRLHVKFNEFNRTICIENDETAREEKWKIWVDQKKQQISSISEVNNITTIGNDEIFDTKVRH